MADDYIQSLGLPFLAHRLRRASDLIVESTTEILHRNGFDGPARSVSTLLLLRDNGPMGVTEIGFRLRLSHPMIIKLARALGDAGLVRDEADPNDHRRRLIALTAKGAAQADLAERLSRGIGRTFEAMFAEAGADLFDALDPIRSGGRAAADRRAARRRGRRILRPQQEEGMVKRLKLGACVSIALLAGPLAAQQPQPGQPAQPGGGPRMVRRAAAPPPQMAGERAEVEMRLVAGMPTITAMVNGRGPYRFGVDTGAPGYLRVTSALAAALGLEPVGQALAGDPSGTNLSRIPLYRVDSLAFGDLRFAGISTTPITLPNPALAELDGIIGISFFQALLLTIDYPRGRLVAAPGALPAADGADVVDFTIDRGALITIPLRIGDTLHQVHLDTGNTRHALFMPAAAIGGLPTRGAARSIGVARTVSQEIPLHEIDLAAPVRIGATALPVTAVAYPAVATLGNVGSRALQAMAVSVDQRNRRVRIVPSAR